jgi:release factor glutamine methyltransferase
MNDQKTWTVLELIQWTKGFLQQKGIENSRREAEDLLGQVLELDRLKLYLAFETTPSPVEVAAFRGLVARRAKREPLQYLLGWQPFMGLKIKTDARALIPRPETERLVELALECLKPDGHFADIGTGSGCIALALLKGSAATGIATDISVEALELAAENARALELASRLELLHGQGLAPLQSGAAKLDLLVSNPPYIPEADREGLMPEVRDYEPATALFGGAEGMDLLRSIGSQAHAFLKSGAWMLLECGQGQPARLREELSPLFWNNLRAEKDQFGVERFLLAQRS